MKTNVNEALDTVELRLAVWMLKKSRGEADDYDISSALNFLALVCDMSAIRCDNGTFQKADALRWMITNFLGERFANVKETQYGI